MCVVGGAGIVERRKGVAVLARDAKLSGRGAWQGRAPRALAEKNSLVRLGQAGRGQSLNWRHALSNRGKSVRVRRADVERLGVGGCEKPGPEERGEEIADPARCLLVTKLSRLAIHKVGDVEHNGEGIGDQLDSRRETATRRIRGQALRRIKQGGPGEGGSPAGPAERRTRAPVPAGPRAPGLASLPG